MAQENLITLDGIVGRVQFIAKGRPRLYVELQYSSNSTIQALTVPTTSADNVYGLFPGTFIRAHIKPLPVCGLRKEEHPDLIEEITNSGFVLKTLYIKDNETH